MSIYYYHTAIGTIGIQEVNNYICCISFGEIDMPEQNEILETLLIKEAGKQLESYFAGKLKAFSLPLNPEGTPFMKQVWALLLDIPYGETRSYLEIARMAGRPKAARAVGLACNRNPIPVIIPCHRVIGSNGAMTGYRGGLNVKKHLLTLEGTSESQRGDKVDEYPNIWC